MSNNLGASTPEPRSPLRQRPASRTLYVPMHVVRQVKVYQVHESELRTISMFNNMMAVCSSVGASLLVLGIGFAWDMAHAPSVSGSDFSSLVVTFVFSAVAFLLSIYFYCSRKSELDRILRETTIEDVPPTD